MNRILRTVARDHRQSSRYVDTWHMFDSAHGMYTPYLRVDGKYTLLRASDGVHYTEAGGDLIAEEVVRHVVGLYARGRN